ncbi:hypothetical protein Prudu_020157 [Prunus dulcis]|uniref:Uncharacterized protein n=1 Tax=Prunus dulcis TaxID=3755 RepID=A0A4Y1RWE8_PRUDU|nr:hypothetical protein Prudu_020157 [Prunus dulcis]
MGVVGAVAMELVMKIDIQDFQSLVIPCTILQSFTNRAGTVANSSGQRDKHEDEANRGGTGVTASTTTTTSKVLAKKAAPESVTKREIARFWFQKRIEEEEHLLAAIKAAARIRALKLSEEDYRRFEESLDNDDDKANGKDSSAAATNDSNKDGNNDEVRVGIKDWWTKSKYAYLNQPAIESMEPPKRRTSAYHNRMLSF